MGEFDDEDEIRELSLELVSVIEGYQGPPQNVMCSMALVIVVLLKTKMPQQDLEVARGLMDTMKSIVLNNLEKEGWK